MVSDAAALHFSVLLVSQQMRVAITIIVVVLVGAALIGLWLHGENLTAQRAERRAAAEWDRQVEPIAAFRARFPRTTKNSAAARLEELAVPLGLTLRPQAQWRPAIEDRDPNRIATTQLLDSTNDYYMKELEQPTAEIDDPPAKLSAFVTTHHEHLLAIERHINTADLPMWTFDLDGQRQAPLPNLLGHVRLSKLLAAHAWVAQVNGRAGEAWEAMHALARLSESLQKQPLLITQLIALALAKIEAGCARKLSVPVPVWQQEFSNRDFQKPLLDGLVGEQIEWSKRILNPIDPVDDGWTGRFQAALVRPYFRKCAADAWLAHAQLREQLKITSVCDLDEVRLDTEISRRLANWNFLGQMTLGNYGSALVRMRDVVVGQEMTSKVIEAKTARASAGHWPGEIAGIKQCVCRGRSWNYSVAPDGTMTLAMDKPLVTPKISRSSVLPLSYHQK